MSSVNLEVPSVIRAEEVSASRSAYVRDLPRAPANAVADTGKQAVEPAPTAQQLSDAVHILNQHFMMARADLKFSVVPDLGMLVVAVVDSHSGTVLMQIPSEQALRTAHEVKRNQQAQNLIETVA